EQKEKAIQLAVEAYQGEEGKPQQERQSLRQICRDVEVNYLRENKKRVCVSYNTVSHQLKGGRSCAEFNHEANAWLKPEEEESVIAYCIELAIRAFLLSHKILKTHIDSILKARIGASFLNEGVRKSWTKRFLARHSERL
ncbi:hypothetical protein BDN67DRAFT_880592, partial [Paxillus ammoniavirescens]